MHDSQKDLKQKLSDLERIMDDLNIGDFHILKYDIGENLTLAGSFDFCYYHDLEITFN